MDMDYIQVMVAFLSTAVPSKSAVLQKVFFLQVETSPSLTATLQSQIKEASPHGQIIGEEETFSSIVATLQSQMEISMHRKERMILVKEETSLSMVVKSLSKRGNSVHLEETFSSTTELSLLKMVIVVSSQQETSLSMAVIYLLLLL